MNDPQKPNSVEEIARRLQDLGFPREVYIGRTNGQWPLRIWSKETESMAIDFLLDKTESNDRTVAYLDIPRGVVREVKAVEKVVERHLEVQS